VRASCRREKRELARCAGRATSQEPDEADDRKVRLANRRRRGACARVSEFLRRRARKERVSCCCSSWKREGENGGSGRTKSYDAPSRIPLAPALTASSRALVPVPMPPPPMPLPVPTVLAVRAQAVLVRLGIRGEEEVRARADEGEGEAGRLRGGRELRAGARCASQRGLADEGSTRRGGARRTATRVGNRTGKVAFSSAAPRQKATLMASEPVQTYCVSVWCALVSTCALRRKRREGRKSETHAERQDEVPVLGRPDVQLDEGNGHDEVEPLDERDGDGDAPHGCERRARQGQQDRATEE